jgi:hypothetical protein
MKLPAAAALSAALAVLSTPPVLRASEPTALQLLGPAGEGLRTQLAGFQKARSGGQEGGCVKEYLIQFVSNGQQVPSETVGDPADLCDPFGGNLAYSPKNRLYYFVNVNIPGVIDLDAVDQNFDRYVKPGQRENFLKIQIAVVARQWWGTHFGDEGYPRLRTIGAHAALNMAGTTLFVSEDAISSGELPGIYKEFYDWP